MSGAIIEADGLTREFRVRDGKRRRLLTAVDGLTVRIEPGEAVDYIGANGAGKSTTIKRLAFDADQTTAAKVLAAVSDKAEVLDLTVEEPDIEDVVRRIYAVGR
jgi:ABC-type uncharacterized transport system ATPase subunit